MILLIDNYDSFSYNLYQMIGAINSDIRVIRNDAMTVAAIRKLAPSHIVISPGPGHPKDAGICEDLIRSLKNTVPLLGVCLGHQAICEAFGATVTHAARLMHGKQCSVHIANGNELFKGLPPIIDAARYHSLAVDRHTLPDDLLVIAEDGQGEVMGVKLRNRDVYGVQFHPESVLTPCGRTIMENFLKLGGVVK